MPLVSPRWLVVPLGRNFAPSEYLRSRVELCDILNTSQSNLTPKTFYSMPKKSKSKFVMKSVQKSAVKSVNNKPYVKKRKINSSLKCSPTVDILAMSTKEIKTENSHHNFDEKNELVGTVLSDYELMCKKNIAEKMAFLESLNIDQAKKDLVAVKTRVKLVTPKPRGLKIKLKAQSPPLRPKSLRLQRISPEGSPLPEIKALPIPTNDHPRKPHGPMLFSDVFAQEDKNLSQNFLKISSSLEKEVLKLEPLSYNRFEKCFRSMKIKPSLVAKVTPTRIFSLAIHPSLSKILICAGSKWGHIGFWDVESSDGQDGVYLFEPHSRPVNCLAYNPENPCELYSSSYDGTVRCGNLQATIFDEIYCADENEELRCTYFDFLSSNSLLVSQSNGSVAVVDTRTRGLKADHYHKTHLCPIKTVNVHPVKKEYFIAAGNNGVVSLWDMRCLKKSSLADLVHGRSVNSAYFSPVTGNTILSTAMDNKLRLFDSSVLNEEVKAVVSIRHDNFTGRWLTGFRATWLPGNEDAFIVGSMLYPRRIEVYQITGMLSHNFEGEDLGSICSINAFHPTRAVLAGANSSGKVHVFMGSEK